MLWKTRCKTCDSLCFAEIKLKGCVICGSLRILSHPTFYLDFIELKDEGQSQCGYCLAKVNIIKQVFKKFS